MQHHIPERFIGQMDDSALKAYAKIQRQKLREVERLYSSTADFVFCLEKKFTLQSLAHINWVLRVRNGELHRDV